VALGLAVGLLLAMCARAEARGTVVKIAEGDLYIDLGNEHGVVEGTVLRVFEIILVTHPVTKKKVRDSFEIGSVGVVRAGKKMCIARADLNLIDKITVGDEVELSAPAQQVVDPWEEATRPKTSTSPADSRTLGGAPAGSTGDAERAATAEALEANLRAQEAAAAAFGATLGRPLTEKSAIWTAYLREYPSGPYTAEIRAEIHALKIFQERDLRRDQEAELQKQAVQKTETWDRGLLSPPGRPGRIVLAEPLAYYAPERIYEGAPVELAFLVVEPVVSAGWIHYRSAGQESYRRAELALEEDGYLRARLPGDVAKPPHVEYFVELLLQGAKAPAEVVGKASAPETLAVDASVEEPAPDRKHRSRVSLFADYVDFDGGGNRGFDEYYQFEADFMYRFRGFVYAMRLGFATLAGEGGPKNVIDAARDTCLEAGTYRCRRVAFNYAYTELEFRLTDMVGVMLRPMVGGGYRIENSAGEGPRDEEFIPGSVVGLRARLRIGRDEETNLVLGFEAVDENFGNKLEAAFTWDVIPRFPVVLSLQATSQPVAEDTGLRLIADVGWRGVDWFYPSVRLSYQARDVDHSGVSGGVAANFDW
jgi:hypothetical protein